MTFCPVVKEILVHNENIRQAPFFHDTAITGPIRPTIKLIRDLTVIYIQTKFGADWLLFVDARV